MKLTRTESYGAYVHNDRKAKNHSNKDIHRKISKWFFATTNVIRFY